MAVPFCNSPGYFCLVVILYTWLVNTIIILLIITSIVCPCSNDAVLDVVFVIDESGSIGASRFQLIREFVRDISTELISRSPRSAVGVILFDSFARIQFNLRAHTSLSSLLQYQLLIDYLTMVD